MTERSEQRPSVAESPSRRRSYTNIELPKKYRKFIEIFN